MKLMFKFLFVFNIFVEINLLLKIVRSIRLDIMVRRKNKLRISY